MIENKIEIWIGSEKIGYALEHALEEPITS
jgi:hypothetical protein